MCAGFRANGNIDTCLDTFVLPVLELCFVLSRHLYCFINADKLLTNKGRKRSVADRDGGANERKDGQGGSTEGTSSA